MKGRIRARFSLSPHEPSTRLWPSTRPQTLRCPPAFRVKEQSRPADWLFAFQGSLGAGIPVHPHLKSWPAAPEASPAPAGFVDTIC